jgi:periplasmic copper chaperone A
LSRGSLLAAGLAVGALLLPGSAFGHVALEPPSVPAGEFAHLDMSVPNERDDATTTKIDAKLPPGFLELSYRPVPGWKGRVEERKLARPVVTSEGEKVTSEVSRVTFTATGRGAAIARGQFQDFSLAVLAPDKPGATLTFKVLQTYSDGDVVRWIGPPDAEEPAPVLKLASSADQSGAQTGSTSEDDGHDNDDSNGLAIVALVVGALGLVAGAVALALLRGRRTSA